MNREQYNEFIILEEELAKSAIEVYQWYSDNIERLPEIKENNIVFDGISERNELWFEGTEYYGEYITITQTLALELLFYSHNMKKIYADNYHQVKAEKYKQDRTNEAKLKKEQTAKATKIRYERYLELEKEFGEEINAKEAK